MAEGELLGNTEKILTAGTTKGIGFLDVTPCSLGKVYVLFRDGRFLHIVVNV
jgi:hypothetical protein